MSIIFISLAFFSFIFVELFGLINGLSLNTVLLKGLVVYFSILILGLLFTKIWQVLNLSSTKLENKVDISVGYKKENIDPMDSAKRELSVDAKKLSKLIKDTVKK
ncbi:MAG: hypothetical protein NC820_03855 [Candidatus Omnitrophica bacterium]|nr:hypothetical protein [Candidatus Omnitrophota bacterium]